MEERYEPLKELGSGNFGVARLVKDKKTKELLAVKYIERGKKVIYIFFSYRWCLLRFFCLQLQIDHTKILILYNFTAFI